MLRVPLIQAKPGMQLAVPVLHPDRPDTMLLRAGFVLCERSIERMRSMFLPEIWIEYPDLRFIIQKAPAPFGAEVSICTSDKPGSVHTEFPRCCDHFSRRAVADAITSDLPAAFRSGRASGLSTGGGCMVLHAAW